MLTGGIDSDDGKNKSPFGRGGRAAQRPTRPAATAARRERRHRGARVRGRSRRRRRPDRRMPRDVEIVGALREIGVQRARVAHHRQRRALLDRAAVACRQHMGDEPIAVGLDRAPQARQQRLQVGVAAIDEFADVGEQVELRRHIGHRRSHRFGRREQRALAGAFDGIAGHGVEAGERRARHRRPRREHAGTRFQRAALGGGILPGGAFKEEPGQHRADQHERDARDAADDPLAAGAAERQRAEHDEQSRERARRPQRQRQGARQRIEPRNPASEWIGHDTIHTPRDLSAKAYELLPDIVHQWQRVCRITPPGDATKPQLSRAARLAQRRYYVVGLPPAQRERSS